MVRLFTGLGKKLSDLEPESPILEVLKSGKAIADDPYINPIFQNNRLIGVVAVFRDLSEVQHLGEKLRQTLDEIKASLSGSFMYYGREGGIRTQTSFLRRESDSAHMGHMGQ